jgi:hypothetical protein
VSYAEAFLTPRFVWDIGRTAEHEPAPRRDESFAAIDPAAQQLAGLLP